MQVSFTRKNRRLLLFVAELSVRAEVGMNPDMVTSGRTTEWRGRNGESHPPHVLSLWALAGPVVAAAPVGYPRDSPTRRDVLELGSGPGLTTDWLRPRVGALPTVEYDESDAEALRRRLPDIDVYHGHATAWPFGDATFDGVVCFTMLHHVPTRELQNRLFQESRRVLRPGGVFAGRDSQWGPLSAIAHLGDTLLVVDPVGLPEQLRAAGFVEATTDLRRSSFRFRAVASD